MRTSRGKETQVEGGAGNGAQEVLPTFPTVLVDTLFAEKKTND